VVCRNTNDSQTAKAVRADQDALFEMFERIEAFFRRLNIYTELAPNQGMVDTMTAIMVEVLNFIGIATKEIKQGRTSKCFLYQNKFLLTKPFTEKYLNKLMGKNDIEDALKKLDRLTQEEALMAAAQLLRVTNTIDNRVGGIADNVLVVDNRVVGIDDRVAGIDERVAGVDERVAGVDERVAGVDDRVACVDNRVKDVDDRVKAVDDKVAAVNDGAQYIFYLSP
jgi:archaellum component FlaC